MAGKVELLRQLDEPQLRELATENGVEFDGEGPQSKDEWVDTLAQERSVTRDAVQAKVDAQSSDGASTTEDTITTDETSDSPDAATTDEAQTSDEEENTPPVAAGLPDNAGNTGNAATPAEAQATVGDGTVAPGGGNATGADNTTPPDVQAGPLRSSDRRPEAVGDPALTDPEETAIARVEGRTSDATTRNADGPHIDEVPADVNAGSKPSDGGPEAYPFPQGGDVEVATVDPGSGDGEYDRPLEVDDWVILDASHELVPDRLDGHIAYVVSAPRMLCNCDFAPGTHEHTDPNASITVRTRDEVGATLYLPMEAFKSIGRGARSAVLPTA